MRFFNPQSRDTTQTRRRPRKSSGGGVALAYVGSIVPNEFRFYNAAFSRSGQMYQQELLLGLKGAGMPPSLILSITPIPGYPKVGKMWIRGGVAYLPDSQRVTLVSFLNITPLKQITIGIASIVHLLRWGWRTRHAKFRVVYTYNLTVPPGLFTLLGARLIRAKAVVSLCDINVPGETVPSGWPWRLDYWLQGKLIPRFDGHIVVSDAIADEFLPGRPYLRLEGGVRDEVFAHTGDHFTATKNPGTPFVITAAGTLNEANGFLILLKAFSLLEGDQYRLCIAGGGPLEQQVRQAAANDSRIAYLGLISFSEVLQLYKHSDVLINMRITENLDTRYFFPGKMMEYLASGTPVITTCTGHTEEEFGDLVYLLRDETPEGLAEIIRHVASLDPEVREKLGQKAREYMVLHKTWDAQAKKVAHFICETVLGIVSEPTETPIPSGVETTGTGLPGDLNLRAN
jgi:glycosyltransferase involved in cell wall biosynthesis